MTDKRYSVVLPKYACSSVQRWERNEGKKPEDVFIFKQEHRAIAFILTVKDGEPFDSEKVRNNANGEWRDYDFEEDLDAGEETDLYFQPRNTRYETAFFDDGDFEREEALEEDGFVLVHNETEYTDAGNELEVEEITS